MGTETEDEQRRQVISKKCYLDLNKDFKIIF